MPRKKRKTREERATEEYFPVDKSDLKYAVEKPSKPLENSVLVENKLLNRKNKSKRYMKKGTKKSSKKKKNSSEDYKPPRIKLKENGYELIITEKPQAASKISSSLGKATKKSLANVPYYEIDRDGEKIVVACAVGHLFTLKQNSSGTPTFDISWVPNYIARKKDFTKRYYNLILKLAKGAKSITVATDYDVEGEVIGLNIVRYLCGQKDANRMKFSTLTPPEINKAYEEKFKTLDWGQAIAGETRHYLDWFYGINLSRALMEAIKTTGRFKLMSIGRVQGPTLNIIVEKERKIENFKPRKYWQIFITIKNSHEIELKHNKDIFDKKQLGKFENLIGQKLNAETNKKLRKIPPNPPFNLTALQTEAYKFYGITPARALQIAQSLYLAGLISYPRTSSQKLPLSISYKTILKKIAKKYNAEELIKREKPIEGKKNDPAHPSIYPTGENGEAVLSTEEQKIYDLIAKRFLALFCEDAEIDNKTIKATTKSNLVFSTNGSEIKKKGWMAIYPTKLKEKELPDMEGEVEIIDMRTEEKETQPPKRYSPASIVSELEKENLGTKATRSSILETLYDRGYVQNKNIEATPLGKSLIETLERYSPVIIDKQLTREFEKETETILQSKNNFEEKQRKIIEKAKETIKKIIEQFEENKEKIGKELLDANIEYREKQRKENTLIECPVCKKGNLIINYSKKNRRYFVACDAYPDCKNTYTLPPNGVIKRTDKVCEDCGWPILIRLSKGKRPWEFCFNPECVKNKERIEEYNRKKEMEN